MAQFEPTRDAALSRLDAFAPKMGRRYTSGRNYDKGPGQHNAVSQLSPYLRRRLITEEEVVRVALDLHGLDGAEKFIQEVVWRGYFKGWLERRPSIWLDYRDGLHGDLAVLEKDRALRRRLEAAEAGDTGIGCFDAWVEELVDTGYVHNHARMWFASIWCFTLELPWRLGADFFYRHLLDGDPASNTLGWRWVAGLHTRGKAYEAQAWNISKFTHQRFQPRPGDLAEGVQPLDGLEPEGLPKVTPLRAVEPPKPLFPTALLITEEDCAVEQFDLAGLNLVGAATLTASHLRSNLAVSDRVKEFEFGALDDAASRAGVTADRLFAGVSDDLVHWAKRLGAVQVATGYVPEGPLRDWLRDAEPLLAAEGIALTEWRRDWDSAIWPYATAGFFKVKQKIPQIVADMEIAA